MTEQEQGDLIEDYTPFQMTLTAMVFPWIIQALFDVVSAFGLALAGAPLLALGWGAALCAADWLTQGLYRRWLSSAADMDSTKGLARLSWVVLLRTILWFGPTVAYTLISHSQAGFAFVAVTAISVTALGVSLGWTSWRIFIALAGPAVVAVAVTVIFMLGLGPAAGVIVGLGSLVATLVLLGMGTHKTVTGWSRANKNTIEVMAAMTAALQRSEAAERRLRIAIGLADLHVYEMDYARRTLTSLGAEQDFFEQPLTYERFSRDPYFGVQAEDRSATQEAWAKYRAGDGPYRAEYRVNRTDGREIWGSASAELIQDDLGRPVTLVGAIQNITSRKRGELELHQALSRAQAGSRAKSEFLAIMSHEIRTPLNGVLGMADAMERDKLAPEQRKRLGVIRQAGRSLLALLNGVLDLSSIEAGRLELEDGKLDISGLVQSTLDLFAGDAAAKNLTFVLQVAADAEGSYSGDPKRVGQLLYNLISNAVKFTPSGSIAIEIERKAEILEIQISDSGIGIGSEQLDQLFENFNQADTSLTRRFGGAGLGLALSKQLAQLMGGDISVESEVGQGSTFTVRLPLPMLQDGDSAAPLSGAADPVSLSGGPPLKVLAAEDNPVNQLVLRTLLQQLGIEPLLVDDGEQALVAWRSQDWDVILMDIQMPVMDGVTATRAIRREEAQSRRTPTPIVAITANFMNDQVDAYRAAGVNDVVAKPIEVGRLIAAIDRGD